MGFTPPPVPQHFTAAQSPLIARGSTPARPLVPCVYLDATYLHVRNQTLQVDSKAVVVATGITAEGRREVLSLAVGGSENEVFWRTFFVDSKKRDLEGSGW